MTACFLSNSLIESQKSMLFALMAIAILWPLTVAIADSFGLSERFLAQVRNQYGVPAEARMRRWQELISAGQSKTEADKLEAVNDFFNDAQFIDDITLWKRADYWATPLEFLARDAGDCEDFSMAKYFTLKEMGVDTSKLRITYVKALTLNQPHMVLAYYPTPSSVPMILDNLNRRIKPASQRSDLKPVYSFNADSLWLSRSRNEEVRDGTAEQLSLWRELRSRMRDNLL